MYGTMWCLTTNWAALLKIGICSLQSFSKHDTRGKKNRRESVTNTLACWETGWILELLSHVHSRLLSIGRLYPYGCFWWCCCCCCSRHCPDMVTHKDIFKRYFKKKIEGHRRINGKCVFAAWANRIWRWSKQNDNQKHIQVQTRARKKIMPICWHAVWIKHQLQQRR